ncbi:MAG: hypothetical protein LC687_01210 [Actinobacteria bacterium]|nr:hypothetical protein [Actinomycetota bacterium]
MSSQDLKEKEARVYDDGKPNWYRPSDEDKKLKELEDSFSAPDATDNDYPENHPSRNDDSMASKSGDGLAIGRDSPKKNKPKKGFLNTRLKKVAVFGTSGVIVSLVVSVFVFFAPVIRLESLFSTINQRVYAGAATAVENRLGFLLERYMVNYVISLDSCTQVRSNLCRAPVTSGGVTAGLFQAWRDTRIEQRLMKHFGLEVASAGTTTGGQRSWQMIGRDKNPIRVSAAGTLTGGPFEGGRRQFGREFNRFLRSETSWYQVMQRRSIRKYLTRKHDIKFWCFMACQTRDTLDRTVADTKTRYRTRFIDRFVYPFSGRIGLYFDCIGQVRPSRCDPDNLRNSQLDRSKLSADDTKRIVNSLSKNPNQRLTTFIIGEIAERLIGNQLSRRAVAAIPVVGKFYLGAWAIDLAYNTDQAIKDGKLSQFVADINSLQYIEYYQAVQSDKDAFRAGDLDLDELAEHVEALEQAEDSLVYRSYTNYNNREVTEVDPDYVCGDGEPIPDGELVCPEKRVARTFKIEQIRNNMVVDIAASGAFFQYEQIEPVVGRILRGIAFVSDAIVGTVAKGLYNLVKEKPAAIAIVEKAGEAASWVFEKIFPLPVMPDSPGREHVDGLIAGGEASAYEFAKGGYTQDDEPYGLGGVELSDEEFADVLAYHEEQSRYNLENSDFLTRIASIDNPNSLVIRAAQSVPTNASASMHKVATMPFHVVTGIFSNVASMLQGQASADEFAQKQSSINAFGIPRYGYPLGHPALEMEPEDVTPAYCEQTKETWLESMELAETTGFDEYGVANPCLLELTVLEVGGSLFLDENFDFDGALTNEN